MSLTPGDILDGRYRVLQRLGRGGMAEVFAAEDGTLGRRVAVKVLAVHLLEDPRARERLHREARTVAGLNHPHIVALHDLGSDGETDFLVMEFVEGPSLADRIRTEGPVRVDHALTIAQQVADGLAAAHAQGLVHRDVKPSNILFDRGGRAKIADFGIARAVQASTTLATTVHGSVPYIAPEQARGDSPDLRSDLYALGCVLFEMLTGRPPFMAETAAGVLGQHLHRDPPPVSALRPDVPPDVDAVVSRLLAKQPEQRYPDAMSLHADLHDAATGRAPTGARTRALSSAATAPTDAPRGQEETAVIPAGRVARGGRGAGQLPRWVTAAAVVIAMLVLAFVASGSTNAEPDRRAAPTRAPTPIPSASPSPTASEPPPSPPADRAQPTSPADPHEAASRIRATLAAARSEGQVSAHGVDELERRLAEALEKDEEGKADDVDKKLDEMRKKLDEFVDKNEIAPDTAAQLRQLIDDFARTATA